MGCGASSDNYLDPASEKRNNDIEKELASDRARLAKEVKVSGGWRRAGVWLSQTQRGGRAKHED